MRASIAWLLILLVIGCHGSAEHGNYGSAEEASASHGTNANETVERAAMIAKSIEATPEAAEQILEDHNLTIEQFEQTMYDISIDPVLSKAYKVAREE